MRGVWRWLDERSGVSDLVRSLFLHGIPSGVAGPAGWLYVFGAALLAVFLLQVVTGVLLAMIYVPSPANAFDSLAFITDEAFLGSVIRGAHFFGASAMVILVAVHVARVFLTASFKAPRELNWLSGVALLLLVFAMAFTGQLLRWDGDAIGSTLIAAEQAGRLPLIGEYLTRLVLAGETIGGATLTRFYALHVLILPGLMFAIVGFHLFLVIRHGISAPPRISEPGEGSAVEGIQAEPASKPSLPYFPFAVWREIVFGGAVILLIVALGAIIGPKVLSEPADPTATDLNPRPDWYMLWLFALLAVVPHEVEDLLIILLPPAAIGVLVLIPFAGGRGNRNLSRRPWAVAAVIAVLVSISTLTYVGVRAPWSPTFDTEALSSSQLNTDSEPVLMGSQIFFTHGCQFCHGVLGEGGGRAVDLTRVRSRLTEDEIRARILAPPEGMPSYAGKLTDQEIERIIEFLNALDAIEDP